MLSNKDFDLWSDNYDQSVELSDEENIYPFAGYKKLINTIFNTIIENNWIDILDVGIGTGILSSGLYNNGCKITGIDFSGEMLKICKAKMPLARLFQYDFTEGLPEDINKEKFDCIVSTYAMHHLSDDAKIEFIEKLIKILNNKGSIIIGDIGFETREEFIRCKTLVNDIWDDDECYYIYDEIKNKFTEEYKITYNQISICAGIIKINK
ncbi:MAG: class I SAM-dependent methyltransferase [Treponema sp.]|jgi:putative AdoMet-dependent methyltransferase|nr:class I SAM-dependent methyltransferase [Treponema sp.]